jgi:soluble P-type ATPase
VNNETLSATGFVFRDIKEIVGEIDNTITCLIICSGDNGAPTGAS